MNPDNPFRVEERRAEIQAQARAIGVTDAYISMLVDEFYDRIRTHEVLGPIFNDAIGDNWTAHLAKMKLFWGSVALNTGQYSGKPAPAHRRLANVNPAHFDTWLALFEATLEETAPSPAAIEYFMERARRIAQSLQLAMFGVPGLAPRPQ